MRAKNLKAHIIIFIFLIASLFAVTLVYQVGVDGASRKNAFYQSEALYDSSSSTFKEKIYEYNSKFINGDASVEEVLELNIDTTYSISEDGYIYFKAENKNGRILLDTIMKEALPKDSEALILVKGDSVIASSLGYNTRVSFEDLIKRTNSSDVSEDVIKDVANQGRSTNKVSLTTLSGKSVKGYLVSDDFEGYKLLRFVSANEIITTKDIKPYRTAFIICAAVIFVAIIINFAIGLKRVSKKSAFEANISVRGANAIAFIKSNGKIVSYNRSFKASFGKKKLPIKSLAEMTVVDQELTLSELIKGQRKFVLGYNKENEENEFFSLYLEFYSIRRSLEYAVVGRECTKEYIDNKILVKKSTKSLITGDSNAIILDKRYREVKETFNTLGDKYIFVMINLKGFKDINTLLGFDQGNDVIKYFSETLKKYFEDLELFHTRADEFVLLDPKANEIELNKKIDVFIEDLKAPININNNEIMLRPAVGILTSEFTNNEVPDYDMLIAKLTNATNKAKTSLKNVCKYDLNLENNIIKERQMEEDLKHGITNGEFVMHYQPQYELNQQRVCGFEALLRWKNPKYATLSPEIYIKMAEKNGFIVDLGNFITHDVFKTAKEMEQYDIHISVNVSPAQIVQAGFVADFLEQFEKNELKPGSIALEITETFLMENFGTVIEKLQILKNRGISIHLDDFGTGYSSMLYLKELPIDTIKVDKEFIKHIETDKFSKVLTSKVITLGKELGDKIICEGVETKIQKDIVEKFGADIIQGYYIGKALSKEDAFNLLKTGKTLKENND